MFVSIEQGPCNPKCWETLPKTVHFLISLFLDFERSLGKLFGGKFFFLNNSDI